MKTQIKHLVVNRYYKLPDQIRTQVVCGLSGYRRKNVTKNPKEVTCKACKKTDDYKQLQS